MSVFRELQILIFEYLNFRPFSEELKTKMRNIRKRLNWEYPTDLGASPVVICNIKNDPPYYSKSDFNNIKMIHFSRLNPKKMEIVMELLRRVNIRRLDFGLKPSPGTYGFGELDERGVGLFGRLNSCYIAY